MTTRPDFAALSPTPGLMGFGPRREPRPMAAPRPPAARPAPVEPPPPPRVAPSPPVAAKAPPRPVVVPVPVVAPTPVAKDPIETPSRPFRRLPRSPSRGPATPTLRDGALLALAAIGHVAPYEDIVMRAWTLWPEVFGLTGHAHVHPDANRVTSKLSLLGAQGYVTSTSTGWRLTREGARRARMVAPAAGVDLAPEVML